MSRKSFFAIIWAILLTSCTEKYDFTLSTAPSQLVITGYVCTEPGQYAINISRTGGYFSNDSLADVPPADVYINDEKLTPCDTIPNKYLTKDDFCAADGGVYRLKVEIDFDGDGVKETYTAEAKTPYFVPLSGLLLQTLSNDSGGSQFPMTTLITFQDPKGIPCYYGAHLYLTTARDSADTYNRYHISNTPSKYCLGTADTEAIDGQFVFYPAYMISKRLLYHPLDTLTIYPNDTIEVELNCHTKDYFTFLSDCASSASGSNPMFMVPAGPVKGNISGGALGAFGVYTISRKKAVVPYKEGSWTDEQMIKRFGVDWRKLFPKEEGGK